MADPLDIPLAGMRLTNVGIDFESPPTFQQWEAAGVFLSRSKEAVDWWIGDWLAYGSIREDWSDRYEQALGLFPKMTAQELFKLQQLAESIPLDRRIPTLSVAHHVKVRNLSCSDQQKYLELASPQNGSETPRLTPRELARAINGEDVRPDEREGVSKRIQRLLEDIDRLGDRRCFRAALELQAAWEDYRSSPALG